MLQGPELANWCELLAVLATGSTVAVALAALLSRRARSAVWERAAWQACTLTLLALVALELTGTGAAAVRLCLARWNEVGSDREIEGLALSPSPDDLAGIETPSQPTEKGERTALAPVRTWWPAIIWGIGSLGILGRMVWSRALLAVFWFRCESLRDGAVRTRVQSIANRLGLRRTIRPVTSNSLRSPAVFHGLFPVLALPSRFSEDFSDEQQDCVLAHELAHLARRDPAWQSAAMLACAVLWWQPLSWWASRRLRAASEAAADEASILLPDGPSQLAASLVSLAERLGDPQIATLTSMQGNGLRSELARRVERLLKLEAGAIAAPSKARLALAHAALPIGFSMLCMLCTAWAPSRRSFTQGDTTVNVLTSAWRSSLAATAMWTALGGGTRLPADEPRIEGTVQERPAQIQERKRDTGTEQDRVREVLAAIRQQVEQLRKEGKSEAAETLMQVAETMTRKFAEKAEPRAGDRSEAVGRKLKAVREQAARLSKEGWQEEAASLAREAEAPARISKEKLDQQRIEIAQKKLDAAHETIEQLIKQGKPVEAKILARQAELMARLSKEALAPVGEDRTENVKQKLRAISEKADQLAKQGKLEESEKLRQEAEAMARSFEDQRESQRSEQAENVLKKLKALRDQADQHRKQVNHEADLKLTREAEADSRKDRAQVDSSGSGGADDLRADLRQVQRDLKELREQLKQLQEHRSGDRP